MATWTAPRTWSSGAVLTAAQLNTDIRDNIGILSTALLITAHRTQQYYSSQGISGTANAAVNANLIYAIPITIPAAATYDRIGCPTQTATGNVRLGIYNDNAGAPGSLVVDGGAVACGAAQVTVTISQSLALGKYWIAALFSGTPTVLLASINTLGVIGGVNAAGASYPAITQAIAYGALPDPFVVGGYQQNAPVLTLRAA